MSNDLLFIAGAFLDKTHQIPQQKRFLYKYFTTDIQKAFVKYWLSFGEFQQFVRHTGFWCKDCWLKRMANRIKKLESLYLKAKAELDFSTITALETGKYKLNDKETI